MNIFLMGLLGCMVGLVLRDLGVTTDDSEFWYVLITGVVGFSIIQCWVGGSTRS